MNKTLVDGDKIKELFKNNLAVYQWIKTGYELHSNDRECCKFCGNEISNFRWEELSRVFTEELKNAEQVLKDYYKKIEEEINKYNNYPFPQDDSLYFEHQDKFREYKEELNECLSNYTKDLQCLSDNIKDKLKNLDKSIDISHYKRNFDENKFLSTKGKLEKKIEDNNSAKACFSTKQKKALKNLILNDVYQFTNSDLYKNIDEILKEKKEKLKSKNEEKNDLEKQISEKEEKIKDLNAEIEGEEEGAKKVNKYLKNVLPNIELETYHDNSNDDLNTDKKIKFKIVRNNGKKAFHLSEGERTIISFCYFMAKLDLGNNDQNKKKPIIFIDDPVSSLDSNHIFYIFSLINSNFFGENYKEHYEQIFISTHNLEFLKYLRQLDNPKNVKYFILNRKDQSTIINIMPCYLKNYASEFIFLFHQIYKCAKEDINENNNYNLFYSFGNNARKFLEILLFYKYPYKEKAERLKKYFGHSENVSLVNRLTNELSHSKASLNPGLIDFKRYEVNRVANIILKAIEKNDKVQYDELCISIGVKRKKVIK